MPPLSGVNNAGNAFGAGSGATRDEARRRLSAALGETVILGVVTNVAWLRRLLLRLGPAVARVDPPEAAASAAAAARDALADHHLA